VTSPRACGTRVAGGVYIEIPLSRTGRPLSDFIFCPPREIDLEANGLTSVGTKLMQEKSGIWHVFDVIGEDSYPNVADFIEETARLGVHRLLEADPRVLSLRDPSQGVHSELLRAAGAEFRAGWPQRLASDLCGSSP